MPIIVGIDGSSGDLVVERSIFGVNVMGEGRNKQYDMDFGMSFVSRICKPESPNKKYLRGPSQFGGGLMSAINQGTQFIINRLKSVNEPVLLTGYSRGAAGAVCVAKKLKEHRIYVKAMLLFDCVDRHMFIDAAVIPDNVDTVHHVFRDPDTNSRNSFDNDGKLFAGIAGKYSEKPYFCTHGGMGGVPWQPEPGQSRDEYVDEGLESTLLTWKGRTNVTFANDEKNSKTIWTDLKPFMSKYGFYTALKNNSGTKRET